MNPTLIAELEKIIGKDGVLHTPEDLAVYSYDGTFEEHRPDLVVLPRSTDQVCQVIKIAARESIPVVTRGMASGLAAASVPFSGGIVLCMTRMDRVLEVDEQNAIAHVEAGVVTADLQALVEKKGLFYPPDPSSIRHSTIGGNIACNAGGPRCLKYGVTKDYVMGLKAVLADGRILEAGGKPIKYVTGYDLPALMVGSEGTLGVITEVLLRLIARPTVTRTGLAVFADLDTAGRAVNTVLSAGYLPATLELMDDTTIHTVEEAMHLGLPLDAAALLIFESDGRDANFVQQEAQQMADLFLASGAVSVRLARDEAEQTALWKGRRSVSPSLARRRPNKLGEDISVPRSAIPEAIRRIKAISQEQNLPIAIFGHAGDGNLHPNILFDRRDAEEWGRVQKASAAIFDVALALGGTLTGEHGVGILKRPFLTQALGPVALDTMQRIKDALDPQGILNPGKKLA